MLLEILVLSISIQQSYRQPIIAYSHHLSVYIESYEFLCFKNHVQKRGCNSLQPHKKNKLIELLIIQNHLIRKSLLFIWFSNVNSISVFKIMGIFIYSGKPSCIIITNNFQRIKTLIAIINKIAPTKISNMGTQPVILYSFHFILLIFNLPNMKLNSIKVS